MKVDALHDPDLQKILKITDFENFFDVYVDKHGNWSYNLNENLYFKFDRNKLKKYTCKHTMFWPLISYQLYGSTRLAWLLMKINDVDDEKMFEPKYPGDIVYYISNEVVQGIVDNINDNNEN